MNTSTTADGCCDSSSCSPEELMRDIPAWEGWKELKGPLITPANNPEEYDRMRQGFTFFFFGPLLHSGRERERAWKREE